MNKTSKVAAIKGNGSKKACKLAGKPATLSCSNMVIAQSGGPSMVINGSLSGAWFAAQMFRSEGKIGKIFGAKHGVDGILKGEYLDLSNFDSEKMMRVMLTSSSALGSCRHKPDAADCRKIFEEFRRLEVGYFFYIGGNDSADAARIVAEEAEKENYPLVVYHIPKTIDNDLRSCDHTPGYASAANFVIRAIIGDDLDNRALGGVKIDIIMGRDAGFLTAASALARVCPDCGPHLIYLPEVPFAEEQFVKDVKAAIKKFGRAVVAVSEGIRGKDGVPIGAKLGSGEKDSHGNVQMSGTGALGDYLARLLKEKADVKRVRADTFGYLQRSFPELQTENDIKEAIACGARAVEAAVDARLGKKGAITKGTIGISRKPGKKYSAVYKALPIQDAAKETRSVPKEFIAKSGNDVTQAFVDYLKPLVGKLPQVEILL